MSKATPEPTPLVVVKDDLRQRDVRALELEMLNLPSRLLMRASSSHHEAMLKAAIGAGWIVEPKCRRRDVIEDDEKNTEYYFGDVLVDDLPPRVCYQAGHVIELLYEEFTSLDPL